MHDFFAQIQWRGKAVRIECQRLQPAHSKSAVTVVFLHEGLGSVSMWRDFPQRVCDALGCVGLVYSRPGYGQSSARDALEGWEPDFLHQQALEVLPALLAVLKLDTQPTWLFGHSDGASIALLHAAALPKSVAGAVVLAPHIFVEDVSIASIAKARDAYASGDLRPRLARHHGDVDSAFWGWNDAWLNPAFKSWNISAELGNIACPVLAVQGVDDEYGSMAQIEGIAARVPQTKCVALENCGHSPHRDQPDALLSAVQEFFAKHTEANS